jgi:hypothetical protein
MIQRDYYPISEAAEKLNCTVENLIHLGAADKLDIYVLAVGWFAKHVFIWEDTTTGNEFNNLKLIDPNSAAGGVYKLPLTGPCLIQNSCLRKYEIKSDNVPIVFDGNQAFGVPHDEIKFIVYPNCSEQLKDAALVIMEVDFIALKNTVADNDGDHNSHSDPENRPAELDIANIAWRAVSNNIKPGQRPGVELRKWLKINYKDLLDSEVDRIATMANWNKKPGAPKKQ